MRKKILVVDDDLSSCYLLENFLSKNYEVHSKSNAIEALNWLNQNLPDLIISDIKMDKMDGLTFLKKVRTIGYTKHTPVIMLSGKIESSERVKCYKNGAQDYLTKPFNPEELSELIKKNLFPLHHIHN